MPEHNEKPHLYIDIAIAFPVYKTYLYEVPEKFEKDAEIGRRVLVPFGKRKVTGYILGYENKEELSDFKGKILEIAEILDEKPIFPENMTEFFKWTSGYYFYPIGEVIKNALPKGINLYDRAYYTVLEYKDKKPNEKELEIIEPLEKAGKKGLTLKGISRKLQKDVSASFLKSMEEAGFISKFTEMTGRTSIKRRINKDSLGEEIEPDKPPELNDEQRKIVEEISFSLGNGFKTWLLAGVTGSGKTEVYMHIAEKCIKNGKSVLFLVPEIALISNIERAFKARFREKIAVLHSGLSKGERYKEWIDILDKKTKIAIGARSAIFAPFDDLGLIIIDEEHDASYKQADGFGYNAKDLAVVRAQLSGCPAILGSATPSIQSYYNVITGKYKGVYLKERIEKKRLPDVHIVDMREKRGFKGAARLVSPELRQALKDTLKAEKQALLFLNRRGFANFPVCAVCGSPLTCRNCDISLTFHKKDMAYKCHYCGFSRPANSACGVCGSNIIKKIGFGTEKIEKIISEIFPQARIARMDKDTTSKKGSIVKILKALKKGDIDILIGTQMIAKGHDFPNITLVGIISADISLNFPDFRAGENTFQILAQVAGRAGRGDAEGNVILQTFNPDHFAVNMAKKQDYEAFFKKETEFRKALNYPPFSRIVQLKIKGKSLEAVEERACLLGELCRKTRKEKKSFLNYIEILGPAEAPISKIASMFRWQILIKGKTSSALHDFIKIIFEDNQKIFSDKAIKITIDIDPFFML